MSEIHADRIQAVKDELKRVKESDPHNETYILELENTIKTLEYIEAHSLTESDFNERDYQLIREVTLTDYNNTPSGAETSYTNSGLTSGKTYYYYVQGYYLDSNKDLELVSESDYVSAKAK